MKKRSHPRRAAVTPRPPTVPERPTTETASAALVALALRTAVFAAPHPKSLGDLPHVFSARWSKAKSDPSWNPLAQLWLMLLESVQKGLIGEDVLSRIVEACEQACEIILVARPEPVDLQAAIRRAAREEERASALQAGVAFRCVMDGIVDAEEAPEFLAVTEKKIAASGRLAAELRRKMERQP